MTESPENGWWAEYFDPDYFRIYEPLLSAAETDREVAAIRELIGERGGIRMVGDRGAIRVLDVPCGWGRHGIELARSGFDVTGVDASEVLLSEARRRAEESGVLLRLVRSDMRELRFAGGFDIALCLFSSLGYFDEAGDLAVLEGIRSALDPQGLLLIETMHRDAIARDFAERDWWESPLGDTVWVEREFDPLAGVMHEVLRWRSRSGDEGEKRHSMRIRAASEWAALLERVGFAPVEWFGDWSLEPFTYTSGNLIVLCEKA